MEERNAYTMDKYEINPICEQQMRDGFATTAAIVIDDAHRYTKTAPTLFAGLEIELPLVTSTFDLASQYDRDALLERFPKHTEPEIAAHQLEIVNEPPIDLIQHGFSALQNQIATTITSVLNEAHSRGLQAIRIGCYPLSEIDDVVYTKGDSRYKKYEQCPQWHMANRRRDIGADLGRIEVVRADNAYIVGLMNAVQITIDAQSFPDAIDKLNRSLMISPYAVAIGANARYLNCRDTGICDIRFAAWEISHDVRSLSEVVDGHPTRIGLPRRYYQNMEDYFRRVQSYPFILNDSVSLTHPFEVGLGLYWRDARLKFFREKGTVAVEFRPVALQPSLHEDVAMMFFFVGRLIWSQYKQEVLLPMDLVRANKEQATIYGLNSQLWRQKGTIIEQALGHQVLADELNRAAEGLRLLGASPCVVDNMQQTLGQRLGHGSPAEQFATVVQCIEANIPTEQKDRRRNAIISAIQQLGLIVH